MLAMLRFGYKRLPEFWLLKEAAACVNNGPYHVHTEAHMYNLRMRNLDEEAAGRCSMTCGLKLIYVRHVGIAVTDDT